MTHRRIKSNIVIDIYNQEENDNVYNSQSYSIIFILIITIPCTIILLVNIMLILYSLFDIISINKKEIEI